MSKYWHIVACLMPSRDNEELLHATPSLSMVVKLFKVGILKDQFQYIQILN